MSMQNFNNEYLNTVLDDGLTIKEHMENSYKNVMYYNSNKYKMDFPKNINEQYSFIISNIYNKSSKYMDITNDEEKILKIFLEKVALIRKNYSIYLERRSDGMIRIYYNGYPTGQFNLREKHNYIRKLSGQKVIDKYDVTFDEIIKAINSWVAYCKYQLKEERF